MSHLLLACGLIVWLSACQRSIQAKDVGDQTQTTNIRVNNTLARHVEEGNRRASLLQTMNDDVPEVHVNSTTASTAVRECKIPKVTEIVTREAYWNETETLVNLTCLPSNVSTYIRVVSG
jgi:hypothetical protein